MLKTSSILHNPVLFLFLLLLSQALAGPIAPQLRARWKKHVSDQRIAELQALIALANRIQTKPSYGHGQVDPIAVGRRRRRSVDFLSYWKTLHSDYYLPRFTADGIEAVRNRLKRQWQGQPAPLPKRLVNNNNNVDVRTLTSLLTVFPYFSVQNR